MSISTARPSRTRRRIERFWKHWRPLLGLSGWEIDMRFHDGPYVMGDGNSSANAIASADVSWEYVRATVDWNLQLAADEDDAHLEAVVVHEAAHILLGEMSARGIKHEERVATAFERALLQAARAGSK